MSGNSFRSSYAPSLLNEYTITLEGASMGCILLGVYLVIAGTNLLLLQKKGYRLLLLYTIVQLVLTTLLFAIILYSVPKESLAILSTDGSSGPNVLWMWPAIINNVTFVLNTWTSDAFLLYRCYIICLGNKTVLALPIVLYLATIGSSLAVLILSSSPGSLRSTHIVQVTGMSYWSCSVATNVTASILISIRLWTYHQEIAQIAGSRSGRFYSVYMAMTLESATLYTVFAIAAMVVSVLDNPLENVIFPVLGTVQAIAPSLIIYRIARGISFQPDANPANSDADSSNASVRDINGNREQV